MSIGTSIFKTAITSAGSFLGGIQTYLIVGAVSAALAFGGGIWLEYNISRGDINALKLADATALTKAVEDKSTSLQQQYAVDLAAAVSHAAAVAKLEGYEEALKKRIPVYVTPHQDAIVCVPVGLVRLLNAAVLQTDPAAIELAPGQSNDACSDVKASLLAGAVVEWLSVGHRNAEQLNALIAWIKANHEAQKVTP